MGIDEPETLDSRKAEGRKNMLESRAAYGYFGEGHGATGENSPSEDFIEVNMKYWDYKHRYPECKNLGDYNKAQKTITVLIPAKYAERGNFGNRYCMNNYYFLTDLDKRGFSPVIEMTAKSLENAKRNAKRWAARDGFTILWEPSKAFEHPERI